MTTFKILSQLETSSRLDDRLVQGNPQVLDHCIQVRLTTGISFDKLFQLGLVRHICSYIIVQPPNYYSLLTVSSLSSKGRCCFSNCCVKAVVLNFVNCQ